MLRPYLLFLDEKGYEVVTATNGNDAVDICQKESFDIIFLDENMPGLSGLETLALIKEIDSDVPLVMITKNEEENIMNMAIGNKIADYLTKPVNPSQILMTLKKNIHRKEIVNEHATAAYRSEFGQIGMKINDSFTYDDWWKSTKNSFSGNWNFPKPTAAWTKCFGCRKWMPTQPFQNS
jgi:DNA-binding response OmpR family regulator